MSFDFEANINQKEEEIRSIFYAKIKQLEKGTQEKDKKIKDLEEKLEKLRLDYEFNYNLIEERDSDLKIYEDKIDSFNLILQEKENEIKQLQSVNEELGLKLVNEKTKRDNSEELLKFNNSKLMNQLKEEKINLSNKAEENKLNISKLHEEYRIKLDEMRINFEFEKRKSFEEFESLKMKLKDSNEKEQLLRKENEEMRMSNNKTTNENLLLIKEKIHLENKIKLYENDESEIKTSNSILSEKSKFLQKEIEELKLSLSSKLGKIESLNKLIEENTTEINALKQKVQIKNFEIERKLLSEKILNEKLKDSQYQLEKVSDEKRGLIKQNEEDESKLRALEAKLRNLTEENMEVKFNLSKLKEENVKLTNEISKLKEMNINNNNAVTFPVSNYYKHNNEIIISKEEDTSNMLDFFKDKNNLINNRESLNAKNNLREKESEIERLNKELEGAKAILMKVETEMTQTYNLYRESEVKYQERINKLELDLIKKDLELKQEIKSSQSFERDTGNQIIFKVRELEEVVENYKIELKLKSEIVEKLKENLKLKISQINKIKAEREKMAEACLQLRARINNLENKNEFISIANYEGLASGRVKEINYREEEESVDNNTYNRNNKSFASTISRDEYEDYKKRRNLILGGSRENDKVKAEAKAHIESIMNKTYRDNNLRSRSPVEENGLYNSHMTTRNKNVNKSRSRSVSKSRSKSKSKSKSRHNSPLHKESLHQAMNITQVKSEEDYSALPKLNKIHNDCNYNPLGLKLLKRTRNKSQNKEEKTGVTSI